MSKKPKRRTNKLKRSPQNNKDFNKTDIAIIAVIAITAILVIGIIIYGATLQASSQTTNEERDVNETIDTLLSGEEDEFGAYFIDPEDMLNAN